MDEKKVLSQFKKVFDLFLTSLMINTIGVLVSAMMSLFNILNVFTETSFYMWAFITLVLWIFTINTFRNADIKVEFKKD